MLLRARWTLIATLLVLGADSEQRAEAGVGDWLQRKVRNAVTDALSPSIDSVVGGAKDVAADLDRSLEARLGQAGGIAEKLLADADVRVEGRVADVDKRLEARILQITTGGNELVDNALGQVDEISRVRIEQIGKTGEKLIDRIDAKAEVRIAQVDKALEARLDQVNGMVSTAIRDVDDALEARIEQLDEVIGKRLANVDIIATKQRLEVERTVLRVFIALAAAAALVIIAMQTWREHRKRRTAGKKEAWLSELVVPAMRILVLAVAAVLVVYVVVDRMPGSARQRLLELAREQEVAYQTSLANFDFLRARHYAAQLEILLPEKAKGHQTRRAKAELFRVTFGRPTALATPEGRAAVQEQLRILAGALGDQVDPDVLTVEAFLLWQHSELRRDEHRAASLCARALRISRNFPLAPMASSYVRAFLHAPFIRRDMPLGRESETLGTLRALAGGPDGVPSGFPLRQSVALNRLVRRLQRASTRAYLEMLDAHVQARLADGSTAKRRWQTERKAAAERVLDAWREFDAGLRAYPELESSTTVLSVFSLNDAMLSRALWFYERPEADRPAEPVAAVAKKDVMLAAKLAPLRIAWAKRYGKVLGPLAWEIHTLEEARRFEENEALTRAFDEAYVAASLAERAQPGSPKVADAWRTASIYAARLGLYVDAADERRVPFAWNKVPEVRVWLAPLASAPPRGRAASGSDAAEELQVLRDALAQRTFWFL